MAAVLPVGGDARDAAPSQRDHILDTALRLMSEHGAGGTSMRQLARACGLNVAAIYHYFPSKAELFRSVVAERQYSVRLQEIPVDAWPGAHTPAERLEAVIVEIWVGAMGEEPIWRLLLGESLRHDETATTVSRELLETIEAAMARWLDTLLPELADRREVAVALVMGQLYTAFLERMFRPEVDVADVRRRARALAELVVSS